MQYFNHINAESFATAGEALKSDANNVAIAGGSDLIGVLKNRILKDYPNTVVNLKSIPNAAYIKEDSDKVAIGALTKLHDIAESDVLKGSIGAVSEAAGMVATPLVRNTATIGGNICQDVRCWFYRYPQDGGGRMICQRKGGEECYAIQGENRYHSIFGGMKASGTPCRKGCPAGTDIPAYMEKIRENDWDAAAEIIMQVNPMPMCTSRICPHPCQDECNQCKNSESVSIHCVERTLGDYILENADRFYTKPENETGKKAAIIGAGPSGLTAAYYLRKQGHDVTIYDAHEKAGGILQYGIPHYRLPRNIVDSFISALEGMGIKFRMSTMIGNDIPMETIVDENDNVFVGTGAWDQPLLGITGEDMTEFGLDFLVEVNSFLKNAIVDEVLVCGGGNVAMDVALTAKRLGAKKVKLVCLEQRSDMPATEEEIGRALEEGVEIINGWGLKEIVTDDTGKVIGLKSMRCTRVFDETNRFSPEYDENDVQIIDAQTIILATGQKVDLSFLGDKFADQIKTPRGLLDVNEETYQTKNEKIFAGGDAATGPNIAIRAIRAGGTAAKIMSAKMGYPISFNTNRDGFLKFDVEGIKNEKGAKNKERPLDARSLIDEDSASLTQIEATEEAKRCMNCGCYSVNASDIAPVLVALDASIITTKKTIPARNFFTTTLKASDMLDVDELVTEILIPKKEGYQSCYSKFRIREGLDFAIASLACDYKVEDNVIKDISIVFGGVAPVPIKASEVEAYLKGKTPDEKTANEAAELAVKDAMPLEHNAYKVAEVKALLSRFIQSL